MPLTRLSPRNAVADGRPLCAYRADPASGRASTSSSSHFGNVAGRPGDAGRAHPHRGPRVRRRRRAAARHAGGDLAGQRRRPLQPPGRPATDKPLDRGFRGWGRAGTDFETGALQLRDGQARRGRSGRRGHSRWRRISISGSPSRGINIGLSTRHVFRRRDGAERRDPVLSIIDPPVRPRDLAGPRSSATARPLHLRHPSAGRAETVFFDI